MERYLGLDAHAHTCTLAVIGPSGRRLHSQVVETNGKALVDAVRGVAGRRHLCLEEGNQSGWLHELLAPHVVDIAVAVPPEAKGQKSDLRDAWTRAEEMRTGSIKARVYKTPQHLAALRSAVRGYGCLVRDTVRGKNRLKSILLSRGVSADRSAYDPDQRGKWLKRLPAPHRRLAELLGRQLDELECLRQEAHGWLLEEIKTHPIIRKLATAPGMGPVRTAQLVAIVGDPHRFRTRRQFWSYCGLGIVMRSSSDWVRQRGSGGWVRADTQVSRGLTKRRHPVLKAVFKGAASTVILVAKGPLYEDYRRAVDAGRKPNLARLTLARRIAGMVLSMWKHQEVYDSKRHNTDAAKTA